MVWSSFSKKKSDDWKTSINFKEENFHLLDGFDQLFELQRQLKWYKYRLKLDMFSFNEINFNHLLMIIVLSF